VEENNFGIRKRLLEYDDVMNKQRQVIYKRRHNALFGERLKLDVLNMFHDVATDLVEQYHAEGDFEGFQMELFRKLITGKPGGRGSFKSGKRTDIIEQGVPKRRWTLRAPRRADWRPGTAGDQ
jgi:preprotein translocase subunit SecA